MIGGLGFGEVIFILVIVLVLFGPSKLPELARSVGSAVGEFKIAQKSAEFDLSGFDQINKENAEKKKKDADALHEKLVQTAQTAGIETDGKTTDELLILISAKLEASSESGESFSNSKDSLEIQSDIEN